jgi:hypothetical protein
MGPGRDADPYPLLQPRSKNRIELFLYSPFVAYEKDENYLPTILIR